MIEKHIVLEDIDPVMFYGVNNAHLQMIKSLYPKLRIVARDNVIRVLGDEEEMAKVEEDIEQMRKHLLKYNMLNDEDILDIVKGKQTKADSVKGVLVYSISGRPIKSRSENQQQLIDAYEKNDMVFAVGPAGTGKTYLSIALAVKALKEKAIKKIILSRPAVEAGEKLGFLPGDMKDKIDPYLQPLYDALEDMIPAVKPMIGPAVRFVIKDARMEESRSMPPIVWVIFIRTLTPVIRIRTLHGMALIAFFSSAVPSKIRIIASVKQISPTS